MEEYLNYLNTSAVIEAVAYIRGHKVVWSKAQNCWCYEDTNTPADDEERPCKKCGKSCSKNEPDPCLGVLPGVKAACCGHGIEEQSYIYFENGVHVRGTFKNVRKFFTESEALNEPK